MLDNDMPQDQRPAFVEKFTDAGKPVFAVLDAPDEPEHEHASHSHDHTEEDEAIAARRVVEEGMGWQAIYPATMNTPRHRAYYPHDDEVLAFPQPQPLVPLGWM